MGTFDSKNHSKAVRKARQQGEAVTFTKEEPGTYDPTTDTHTSPTTTTITGYAVELPGDPEEYEELKLTLGRTATLFFAPDTLGEAPEVDSKVTWAGLVRTVAVVRPIQPAGVFLAGRVMVTV